MRLLVHATLMRYALAVLSLSLGPAYGGEDLVATVASQSGEFAGLLDTASDPDGTTFYFTGISPSGPAVFKVASTGGQATVVFAGAPFVSPTGIAVSGDGRQLYVADPRVWAGPGRLGQIFVLPVGGGRPQPLRGADGGNARGVEIVSEGGQETVYYTGSFKSGTSGIYKIASTGADGPTVVFEGAPIVNADSVAVSRAGVVYFTDLGDSDNPGSVGKIEGGVVSSVVDSVRLGHPAGIALSLDESYIAISSLQPYKNRAQVLSVDLVTFEVSATTNGLPPNPGPAGLHRARNAPIFAWADMSYPMPPGVIIFKIMRR